MNEQTKETNTGGNTRTPTPQETPPPETALRAPHTTHQTAPRMIDLRLLTPATATWATTWWATTHPAPHPLIADSGTHGGLFEVRRTRAGDAWQARQASPESDATVALGMPTLRVGPVR